MTHKYYSYSMSHTHEMATVRCTTILNRDNFESSPFLFLNKSSSFAFSFSLSINS